MIVSLGIENLGVISGARLELGPGLTVVTGETGAGKTMFVTALNLLTGARADAHVVRAGAQKAIVEGVFDLAAVSDSVAERISEAGGDADEEAIIGRVIPLAGRARATAGGRTVPLGVLRDVGAELVSMHGQSEQITLRSPAKQRELLDTYAGTPLAEALADYQQAHSAWRELQAKHERLLTTVQERAERTAFLTVSLEAIDAVRPLPGEDTELKALAARLGAAEDLKAAVSAAHDLLVGSDWDETANAADLINRAAAEVGRAAAVDDSLTALTAAVTDAGLRLSDTAAELSAYLQEFDDLGDMSLEDAEARRAELGSLAAFGVDVEAVLDFEQRAGQELLELQNSETSLADMDERVGRAEDQVRETGNRLMEIRRTAAAAFAAAVSAELSALSMPRARIVFEISPAAPHALGADSVRMLFSAHDASQPGDIGRLASGGELSRVMLAIEVVKAERLTFPTFVFDEVDAGVGGKAAIEIGRRLALLAQHSQVIVVTHLAQVAAWADQHLTVVKDDREGGAVSGVDSLDHDGRIMELARMLGGMADSGTARAHAAELLQTSAEEKAEFASGRPRAELAGSRRGRMGAP
ncbi:DNA repair protein RecN [Brevibacterium daeguense]|uniref:DNA repair protein RecN n=1 Tax=Brevibacterium daeguense TaxID=909936 RepID=A0ABP8EMN5_9MICO|nr:DNA repair protein RecN [Brevibacterium daeguense]